MAPSTSNLKQLLEYQSKCERLEMFDGQGQLVLVVTHFIIKLRSEDDEIIILLRSLEVSAKLCWSYSRHSEEDRKFSTMFWDFVTQLKVFFEVPKFNSTENPNELVAAFIDLFLEILEEILHLQPYFIQGSVKEFILAVKKELEFLIIFLGDTPSQLTQLETTKNVLSDIEVVANEVGSFLYSFFFCKEGVSIAAMNKSLSDLLRNVELVKESIKKHCVTVANLWPSDMTPKTATVSLSFVDSILDDIDDLVHRNGDRIADVKDQIRTIHQNLMNLKHGIKELGIEWHQECEEFYMQLINVAYEVEYIINSFAPVSYITLRLLQVSEKIKPMRMQLQELKENDARSRWRRLNLEDAEYPRQHISLQDHPAEEYLVELADDERHIIDLLTRLNRLAIISISGMPGIGKTTLARRIFVHPIILLHFDKMAWCVVSQTGQMRNMLVDILMSTSSHNKETILNLGNDELAKEVYKCLKGTRYIIVMDDIWNVKAWVDIKMYLPDDSNGSKILFTSQNRNVAMMASYGVSNRPLHFQLDESWHLLQDHTGDEYLVGFEDRIVEIKASLLGEPSRLKVISITGMPGTGKTIVANKLYNDPMIQYHFYNIVWCVVSQPYQKRNVLIDILQSVSTCNKELILTMRSDYLADEICSRLKGRRYIVIMDDIRNVNAWNDIKSCFPDDHNGSRILLFTSRNMDVAISNWSLRFWVEDESWDLLQRKVFNKERCPPELVDVGKKIARNCGGLPITIVMIASVLKNLGKKRSLWMEVAENITSYISKETNEYMSVLEQSYNDLPVYLKPCFLYLGVFEKGREIPVQKLIMLWHAEGFIGKVEDKSSEDVAQEYLMDLIDRSMLLVARRKSDGGIKSCTIHGAMHDMCLRLAEKDNFMKVMTDRLSIYEQHHRLSIHSHSIPSFSRPFGLHIHSLLGYLPDPSAFMFSSLKRLKVLDLLSTDLSLYNLSGSEVLAFLRFLAVSSIPSSIEIFKNLEFLFVDNKEVVEIPVILSNMVKLRHVHFSGGAQFIESWRQATHDESFQISNLQNLSSIFIYDENDEKILRSFPRLRILKCRYTVFWDSSENCYRYPALHYLYQLESLNISFHPSYESDDISPESISLPSSLRKLTLRNFDFSWKHMKIIGELPFLEVLKLRDDTIEGKQWDTNEGEFVRLKYLELDAVQIEHWKVDYDNFPRLERLVLRSCHLLKEIPFSIGEILTLQKIEVRGCTDCLEYSAKEIWYEQLEMGNDELKVIISSF